MFETSLFESEGRIKRNNGRAIAVAVIAQGIAFCGLFLAPLFSPASLPPRALQMVLTAPPPPPPLIPVLRQPIKTATSVSEAVDLVRQVFAARIIPRGIPDVSETPDLNPSASAQIDTGSGVANLLNSVSGTPAAVVRPGGPASNRGPVRISGGVMQGRLDLPIVPTYPTIARAAHMEGTVVVAAVISRTGAIENLQVTSGPVMLRQAALDAIRRAHYKPFKLNGEAVEVDTTISVVFSLGDTR
jgi:protein TonB